MLCPSLLSPRALFLHGEEQWDAGRSLSHFALCSSCSYLPFCKAKIPSPSVTGLSYLQISLLSSQGLRKKQDCLTCLCFSPLQETFLCWDVVLGFHWIFLLEWTQALCCWKHSFELFCGSLSRELMPWQLPCCPQGQPGIPVSSL